eukprot:gene6452-35563_t
MQCYSSATAGTVEYQEQAVRILSLELCSFSGFKIHPGHGRRLTRVDGKTIFFLGRKHYSLAEQRKNPRKIAWTAPYRRKFKKGQSVETSRKRARKVVKYQRGVQGGLSAAEVKAKKSEAPDARKLKRDQAIRAAKEKAKKDAAARKKHSGGKKGGSVPKNMKGKMNR